MSPVTRREKRLKSQSNESDTLPTSLLDTIHRYYIMYANKTYKHMRDREIQLMVKYDM